MLNKTQQPSITHLVHLYVQWVDNVVVDQLKVLVANPVLHVTLPPREEVVHHNDLMTLHHQSVHQV